jgi:hypothetical protein
MGEDVLWGLYTYSPDETSVEEIIRAVGHQFASDRTEERQCVSLNGVPALRLIVTTSLIEGWRSESILIEHAGAIYRLTNGAVRDERFYAFCTSMGFGPFPRPTPGELEITPPPGLIYRTADGLWRVGADGESVHVFVRPDVVLFPGTLPDIEGAQALLLQSATAASENTDVWLVDLRSGEERNLTAEGGRIECCPQWWPARPEVIILGSWPSDTDIGPSTGYLTAVSLDGTEYHALDEEYVSYAMPALSPDGGTIAYDRAGTAWLYRWDRGPEPFDATSYGLTEASDLRIASPAWSPDGRKLAWVAGADFGQGWQMGVAFFDLQEKTYRLLHPYEPAGAGGWPSAPVWSPDGQWLAFNLWPASDLAEEGLWLFHASGQDDHYLGQSYGPVWSPDGNRLAFNRESGVWMYDLVAWRLHQVTLPPGAQVVGWAAPEP